MTPARGSRELRKFWVVLIVLAFLTPLGIYLPKLLQGGGAWGEWGVEEVEKMIGYAPRGMKKLADFWKAPLTGYALPGQESAPASRLSVSYVLSALLGIVVCGGGAWLLGRWLAGKKDRRP
ncbi:MAG: cobalamin biosynthesis protein [Deltaproteobacteria bacterium]|nr:cobalamin biosynthesis protein [Deltaproteobacteria bacterium]